LLIKERKNRELFVYISQQLETKIIRIDSVSGGDIADAYRLTTKTKAYFLKINRGANAQKMTFAEKRGLETMEATKTISVPHVWLCDNFETNAFLLMDWVEKKSPSPDDYRSLAGKLAQLHQHTATNFGFSEDNFIGLLPQSNHFTEQWSEFYAQQRIMPQCKLAVKNNLLTVRDIPEKESMVDLMQRLAKDVKPSLLHGDLWGGNFVIATDGTPYLIDPAVYYGHSLVDIAMTQLFGGFRSEFYETYYQHFPKTEFHNELIQIYQLYYLLVHLNIFGSSYRSSVLSILNRYF